MSSDAIGVAMTGEAEELAPAPAPQPGVTSPADIAIRVRDLSKHYFIYARPEDRLKQSIVPRLQRLIRREPAQYYQDFAALEGVSFEVRRGETVGIIGRNGCGKSTLLQIICGTLRPSEGALEVNGRIAALLELGAGFNPEFTGRENVFMNAAILGLSRAETEARFEEIAAFADIGPFIERPVKTYSSGMYVRLAFAVAINVDPDILVIDEALAVGDVAFQRKCFARLEQIRERGATILFVSHSTGSIVELCDRALLLDGGELLLDGKPKRVVNQYLKLVHMPADKVAEARERVRALKDLPDEHGQEEPGEAAADEPKNAEAEEQDLEEEEGWFDPNLVSQSVVEYESKGARIRDLRILTPSGRQVNVLKTGQTYVYEYYVDFHRSVERVSFGMMVKTVRGYELGGASTSTDKDLLLKKAEKDTSIRVRYGFRCICQSGVYFMNAGTSGSIDGERHFIHRLVDGVAFRVDHRDFSIANGTVDFQPDPVIEIFEKCL